MTTGPPIPTLVYRITHIANVPWVLDHGLHCDTSPTRDPGFRAIGNPDLIGKRRARLVDAPPGGTLADYVPFYFGTHSRMLYNIHTGWGVAKVDQAEIVHLVTSVERLTVNRAAFLFTDRHAYVAGASFIADPARVGELAWDVIQSRSFRNDPERPERNHQREAELLVHRHLPAEGLVGIACYDEGSRAAILRHVESRSMSLPVEAQPNWYFR